MGDDTLSRMAFSLEEASPEVAEFCTVHRSVLKGKTVEPP
jgi:hypothetical protein